MYKRQLLIWHPQQPDFRTENFKTIFWCSFFARTWVQALLPIPPCQQSALESLLADLLVILVCGCVVWLKRHKITVKYCTLITINQRPREEDCISVIQVKNLPILRKRTTLPNATNGFPAKWRLRNKCRNSILMTRHYLDLRNYLWLVMPRVKFASTNQKHYPDLGSDVLSVWNFLAHFSDVSSRGNHWWCRLFSQARTYLYSYKDIFILVWLFRRGEEFDLSKHPQVMCGETTST